MALRPFPLYDAGFDARGSSPGLNTIHREVLDIHHNELIDIMEPRAMVCELLSQNMLGDFHCLQMEYIYPQGKRAANRLLLAFLRKQGSAGYAALQKALTQCGESDVVAKMIQTEREVLGVLRPGMPCEANFSSEGTSLAPYIPRGHVVVGRKEHNRLVTLERTVEVLAHLVRDAVLAPAHSARKPLDPEDRITSLERQLTALEAAVQLEVRGRTQDSCEAGVLVHSRESSGHPLLALPQTDGPNAMFLADLNHRLCRVETMLGQGRGGQAMLPAPTPTPTDQRLNDFEAKVNKMKQLVSELLMRSAQKASTPEVTSPNSGETSQETTAEQTSPEPSSLPAQQTSAKPPSPPAPHNSPGPSDPPASKKTPEPADPPAPEKSPEPAEPPAPEKSPEPADPPAPEKSPEPAEPPAPEKSPEPADPPAPEKSPEPADPPAPEKSPEPADPPAPQDSDKPPNATTPKDSP